MNNLKKEFVPYTEALELKQLGFDEPCFAHLIGFGDGTKENGEYKIKQQQVFYPNDTSIDDKAEELGLHPFVMYGVPLYQQAFRWFRKKGYRFSVIIDSPLAEEESHYIEIWFEKQFLHESHYIYKTYEDGELGLLKKLIQYEKEKQQ
jgi:hypothetical protein